MAEKSQSPIFVRTEVFMVWLLEHTRKFPKHERFRLAKWIDDSIRLFHECLTRAAQSGNTLRDLYEADIQLDLLRAYLRLSLELRYTAPNQFAYTAEHTTEIGKLLGGWIKSVSA
jgi:hypothetical protein